jgi:hypothetical protein
LGRDDDRTPVVAEARASYLVIESLLNLLKMNAALGAILLKLPNELADFFLDFGWKPTKPGQYITVQH